MPDLSDVVEIDIVTTGAQLATPAFNVPLVLDPSHLHPERLRFYSSLDAMEADGYDEDDAAHQIAQDLFSPTQRINKIAVGRLENVPTQRYAVVPTAVNSTLYQIEVEDQVASFTSDSSATVAEVCTGLASAVNGLTLAKPVTASSQTTYLRILVGTAGVNVHIKAVNRSLLSVSQDHSDPGIAADLTAIQAYNPGWYLVFNAFNSAAMGLAIAAWVQTRTKGFICDCDDTASARTVVSGAQDLAGQLFAAKYTRTLPIANEASDKFLGASLAGVMLTKDPAKGVTWAYKALTGQTASGWDDTEIANLRARNMTIYYTLSNKDISHEGKNCSGTFFDLVPFGLDSLISDIQNGIVRVETDNEVVHYTDEGVQMMGGAVEASLSRYAASGLLAKNPAPTIILPTVASQDPDDRAERVYSGIEFDAQSSSAIHKVKIHGRVL